MDIDSIRIISAVFSILGSSILAIRVAGILKALAIVANAHEYNIKGLSSVHQDNGRALIQISNSTQHVQNAQKRFLLITGFVFVIMAAVLQLLALVLHNGWFSA